MMRSIVAALLCTFLAIGLSSCGSNNISTTSQLDNTAPVASAGPDQQVAIGATVTLDGSASSDAESNPLTYTWSFSSIPSGSSATLTDTGSVGPAFTADIAGDYVVSLTVNDGTLNSTADTVTITAGFLPPADHTAVNFTIDDSANKTYDASDGLAWKGSFSFDPASRVLTFNGSWSGPFVMLYDDGPWTTGGHEPAGAMAGDSIWGVTVWVSNTLETTFEYGAISGSVSGSDGSWIWTGSNGTVTVPAGGTTPVDAAGLVIAANGTIDLGLTIDISANGANLAVPFSGTDYTGQVSVKGSTWGWNEVSLVDDGTLGDSTAGDGIYTFVLSEHLGKHDGLLHSGDQPEFIFVLGGTEYRVGGIASSNAVSARYDSGSGWTAVPVETQTSGSFNTFITAP